VREEEFSNESFLPCLEQKAQHELQDVCRRTEEALVARLDSRICNKLNNDALGTVDYAVQDAVRGPSIGSYKKVVGLVLVLVQEQPD
jgi:hypothetical protein